MTNDNNAICAICGFALGHHRHIDKACPTQINPHLYNYRQTKFEPIIPDQSETMKMKGPDLQQIPKKDVLGKVARATVDKVNSLFKIITDDDRQRIGQEAMAHSTLGKNYLGETLYDSKMHDSFKEGAEYATIYEREKNEQANIFKNNIIDQLQIRVEQDIVKIKKLQDDARDYSAWQSEYRASRAEIERLKAERTELRNKVIEECIDIIRAEGLSTANVLIALINEKNEQHGEAND